MRIAVCVKAVPDPDYYNQITIHPETKRLVRDGIPTVINAADRHAIELALTLKEQAGGEITVFSMGPQNVRTQLLETLAMGADRAILLSDRAVGGADTFATSYTLAKMLEKAGGFDLILAGNESADGATSHVPSQIGEWLRIGHAAGVSGVELKEGTVLISRKFETGTAKYRLQFPCVLAVTQQINTVRHMNVMEILRAKKKPLEIWNADELTGLDRSRIGLSGSPSQTGELSEVKSDRHGVMLKGRESDMAKEILEIIRPYVKNR